MNDDELLLYLFIFIDRRYIYQIFVKKIKKIDH